ncbi:DUF2256 domain-containing protein [Akkermansiaceae bacterium]|nr:DUF2256 domain-containing protein [Akkermansiaceae bacterium]
MPCRDCAGCVRPFTWRSKWEKVWDQFRYCSERCSKERR